MEMNVEKNKKKYILIGIIVGCILLVGGTYALLSSDLIVNNGNVNGIVDCFQIDYNISNDGSNTNTGITGVLFPTKSVKGGLSGKVAININASCDVGGTGTLYLNVGSGTSTTLVQTVAAHCEKSDTLETLDSYTTSGACTSNGGRWVSNGTALKYAVYPSSDITGAALTKGYITANDIGKDITIYDNFSVSKTVKNYYIYIWMDGYLAGDGYENLPFGGSIHAKVVQTD